MLQRSCSRRASVFSKVNHLHNRVQISSSPLLSASFVSNHRRAKLELHFLHAHALDFFLDSPQLDATPTYLFLLGRIRLTINAPDTTIRDLRSTISCSYLHYHAHRTDTQTQSVFTMKPTALIFAFLTAVSAVPLISINLPKTAPKGSPSEPALIDRASTQ
jgi:hypothetical protein